MFNIETKINDAPHLHEGRRFAEEDNSIFTELKHVIDPFHSLTAADDYQLVSSIKAISDLKDKYIITGTNGVYTLLSGIQNQNIPEVNISAGMRFRFTLHEDRDGEFSLSINGSDSYLVKRNNADLPNGTWKAGIDYVVEFTNDNTWVLKRSYAEYLASQNGLGGPWANQTGDSLIEFLVADAVLNNHSVNLQQLDAVVASFDSKIGSSYYEDINPNGVNSRITDELFIGDTSIDLLNEDISFIKVGDIIRGNIKLKLNGFAINFPVVEGMTFTYDYRSKIKDALDVSYQDINTVIGNPTGVFISLNNSIEEKSEGISAEAWAISGGKLVWYANAIMGFTGSSLTTVLYQASELEVKIPFTIKLNKD